MANSLLSDCRYRNSHKSENIFLTFMTFIVKIFKGLLEIMTRSCIFMNLWLSWKKPSSVIIIIQISTWPDLTAVIRTFCEQGSKCKLREKTALPHIRGSGCPWALEWTLTQRTYTGEKCKPVTCRTFHTIWISLIQLQENNSLFHHACVKLGPM